MFLYIFSHDFKYFSLLVVTIYVINRARRNALKKAKNTFYRENALKK